VGLYAYHLQIEQAGESYFIKCEAVDPRDLLRGNYIYLRYKISELPDRFQDLDYSSHDVFVTLQPSDGGGWEIRDVEKASPSGSGPYLKGRANGREIEYGIERYYVPEGKGRNVPGNLLAEIVIQPGGMAQLKKILSDGKPWPK
jgi:uncharacterized membrane-anchored protein